VWDLVGGRGYRIGERGGGCCGRNMVDGLRGRGVTIQRRHLKNRPTKPVKEKKKKGKGHGAFNSREALVPRISKVREKDPHKGD